MQYTSVNPHELIKLHNVIGTTIICDADSQVIKFDLEVHNGF